MSLSEEQRKKAEQLRAKITDGKVEIPEDFIEWNTLTAGGYKHGAKRKTVIDATKIEGPFSESHAERLEGPRAVKILTKLLDGDWELKGTKFPPVVVEIDGEYYVATDGLHRSMVHKYLGLDLYVELHENSELA